MKVLIISASWKSGGGADVIASEIYDAVTNAGHTCLFAYARGNIPSEVNSYKIGTMFDVYMHALFARIFDNAGFMSTRATNALITKIKDFKPDVISIQNPLGYVLDIERLLNFIRDSRIPTFWTLHDCWAMTGHCITGLCERWHFGCGDCPRKREYPTSWIFDRSDKNYQRKKKMFADIGNLHFITPSQWLANLVKQSYLKNSSVVVIPNGIDLKVFFPTESDLREKYHLQGKVILLAVANVWTEYKGKKYFYKLTEIFDEKFSFVMIGKNNDDELKNNRRIIHIEHTVDRQELVKWYSVADVFVNPTMGDNFPTVNIEALACGTPVVTFDTGGSAESVGDCGEIVTAGDAMALAKGVRKCINRQISAEECKMRAGQYDKRLRFRDYIAYYKLIYSNLIDR